MYIRRAARLKPGLYVSRETFATHGGNFGDDAGGDFGLGPDSDGRESTIAESLNQLVLAERLLDLLDVVAGVLEHLDGGRVDVLEEEELDGLLPDGEGSECLSSIRRVGSPPQLVRGREGREARRRSCELGCGERGRRVGPDGDVGGDRDALAALTGDRDAHGCKCRKSLLLLMMRRDDASERSGL